MTTKYTRFLLRGGNALAAEKYAESKGWSAVEWFYIGGLHSDELIIIDLDQHDRL
jgi:hypothetical protein